MYINRKMAPIDSTSTSQAMAKISSPLMMTVRVSKASEPGPSAPPPPRYWHTRCRHEVGAAAEALLPDRAERSCRAPRPATAAASQRVTPPPSAPNFGDSTMTTPAKPSARPSQWRGRIALAEKPAGEHGRDQRLQPDDQRRKAGRHAADGSPRTRRRDRRRASACRQRSHAALPREWLSEPSTTHQDSQQDGGEGEARGQEGERLRPWHGIARADEAGRPQDDERGGDEPLDAVHFMGGARGKWIGEELTRGIALMRFNPASKTKRIDP